MQLSTKNTIIIIAGGLLLLGCVSVLIGQYVLALLMLLWSLVMFVAGRKMG